ncbi:D-sedoheptulose-7-phosphate isomerase [Opitutus terrae]|uniref:Phosphoheptose isomerase n=1 Tax=Opitutus terrae (strain DSM 11246 / JCM 15787 / PB90-1) TaxID=452637 RepID=B1ZY48_OPITP|nr:SIS domain-containing protein [Opitutus terrae]ACB76197.1 phosphoheptose isomerase [Opitutus terrae PB90-1]
MTVAAPLTDLLHRYPELRVCAEQISRADTALRTCFAAQGKLLLCGNGGSAADCEHIAAELLKGFMSKRPLSAGDRQRLPAGIGERLQGGLPAIPLCGFPGFGTAFLNDVDPQLIYAQLTWVLGRPGDVLLALSTSGTSPNVCRAVETARACGLVTIGLTGRTGGDLTRLTDICINVPADETYRIQEYHLPIYHCLCRSLEQAFFPSPSHGV